MADISDSGPQKMILFYGDASLKMDDPLLRALRKQGYLVRLTSRSTGFKQLMHQCAMIVLCGKGGREHSGLLSELPLRGANKRLPVLYVYSEAPPIKIDSVVISAFPASGPWEDILTKVKSMVPLPNM